MARALDVDSLIDSIKTRAMIPETQNTFTEARFLRFANEEIDMAVLPVMLGYHDDYFSASKDYPLVSGQSRYKIPSRAIGNALRDVYYVDSSGTVYEMTRVSVENLSQFQYGNPNFNKAFYVENDEIVIVPEVSTSGVTGSIRMHYYLRPNQLVSSSRVSTISAVNFDTGVLTVSDTIPSAITSNQSASGLFDIIKTKSPHISHNIDATCQSIDTAALTFKFGTANIQTLQFSAKASMTNSEYIVITDTYNDVQYTLWANVSGGDTAPTVSGTDTYIEFDVSSDTSAADVATTFEVAAEVGISGLNFTVSTDTVTVTTDSLVGDTFTVSLSSTTSVTSSSTQTGAKVLDTDIVVGDYIAIAEECIIPQMPTEAHSLLAQRVAARCLEALGDAEGLQIANAKIVEMETKLGNLMDSRVDGAPLKVQAKHGFLRKRRNFFGG